MDEVKRFFRYTLPGLTCVFELAIAFTISFYDQINIYCLLKAFDNVEIIGIVFGSFFISGALGYLIANIYFGIYWKFGNSLLAMNLRPLIKSLRDKNAIKNLVKCDDPLLAIDFRPLIKSLRDKKAMDILDRNDYPLSYEGITKKVAWEIIAQYFDSHSATSDKLRGIKPLIDRIVDITHSIGTLSFGSSISLILWTIYIAFNPTGCLYLILIPIGWMTIIYILFINYQHTKDQYKNLVSISVADLLLEEVPCLRKTIVFHYIR